MTPDPCNPVGARASGLHRASPWGRQPPARIVQPRGGASLRPASCNPAGARASGPHRATPWGASLRSASCDPVGAPASGPHRAIPWERQPPARIVRSRGGASLRSASCDPSGALAAGPHRATRWGRQPPARIVQPGGGASLRPASCNTWLTPHPPSRLLRERKSVGSRTSGHCHAIPTRFKPLSPQRTSLFAATDDLKTRYNVSHKDGNTSSNL